MNKEAQRIAIAKEDGFRNISQHTAGLCADRRDGTPGDESVPDYPIDLNAMHEAEKLLPVKQWNNYTVNLARVIAGAMQGDRVQVPTNVLLSATAAQRAEAFLRTLNLWNSAPKLQT